jgi:hypothetical protein
MGIRPREYSEVYDFMIIREGDHFVLKCARGRMVFDDEKKLLEFLKKELRPKEKK